MSAQVTYECVFLDAMRELRNGTYVSPYLCLEHTTYTIPTDEVQAYYDGCIDAVTQYKTP